MALKRRTKLDFKLITKYVYYLDSSGRIIKEFECPFDMKLRDRHYQIMLAGPSHFHYNKRGKWCICTASPLFFLLCCFFKCLC